MEKFIFALLALSLTSCVSALRPTTISTDYDPRSGLKMYEAAREKNAEKFKEWDKAVSDDVVLVKCERSKNGQTTVCLAR